jgi:hypothetical protein
LHKFYEAIAQEMTQGHRIFIKSITPNCSHVIVHQDTSHPGKKVKKEDQQIVVMAQTRRAKALGKPIDFLLFQKNFTRCFWQPINTRKTQLLSGAKL